MGRLAVGFPPWIASPLNTAHSGCQRQTASVPCAAFFRQEAASNCHRAEQAVNKGHTCSCSPPVCLNTDEPPLPSLLCRDNSEGGLHGATCQAPLKPISHLLETHNIAWKLSTHFERYFKNISKNSSRKHIFSTNMNSVRIVISSTLT